MMLKGKLMQAKFSKIWVTEVLFGENLSAVLIATLRAIFEGVFHSMARVRLFPFCLLRDNVPLHDTLDVKAFVLG